MTKIKVKADKNCGVEQIVPVHFVPSREKVLDALRRYPESDYRAMIRASKQYRKADALLEGVE